MRSYALERSDLASRIEAAAEAQDLAELDPVIAWDAALTDAESADAEAVTDAVQTLLTADATAIKAEVDSSSAADAAFYTALWSAWSAATQGMVAADKAQVAAVGLAAVGLATELLAAERQFGTDLTAAYSENGKKLAAAAWAFRLVDAEITGLRAIDATTDRLAKMKADTDLSHFATLYSTTGGPGGANAGTWAAVVGVLDYFSGGTSNSLLLSSEFGAALDAVDGFFAGMADALTAGLSTRARAAMWGDSATKNHQGGFFVAGQITGTVLGMAIGAGSPCALGTGLKVGYRVLKGVQMVGGAVNAGQNLAEGNYLAAAGDALGVVGGVASFMKACFVAGTPAG